MHTKYTDVRIIFVFDDFFLFLFFRVGRGEGGRGGGVLFPAIFCAYKLNYRVYIYIYILVLDNIKRIYCRKQLCIIFLLFFVTRSTLGEYFISVHKATRFSDKYRDKKWNSGWKLVYYSYFELPLLSELCIMEFGSKTSQINLYIHMGNI